MIAGWCINSAGEEPCSIAGCATRSDMTCADCLDPVCATHAHVIPAPVEFEETEIVCGPCFDGELL